MLTVPALVMLLASVDSAVAQFNCTCLFTENSNVTVPTGTRLVTVADVFGVTFTYETLCPCSCAVNCTCITQQNTGLAAENVYQPYYFCPSTSTRPMAMNSTWSTTATPPTSVASPNCSVPGSAQMQMYLPGTYASGQVAGSSISVAISCPCNCFNASCTIQTFNYALPTVYQPYQFCTSTTAPTTTSPFPFPCTFSLPTSNTSFPPGTYFSTPIVALNQSLVISCPCSCNSTVCSLQTVSALLPSVFTPYALCSSPSSATATPTAAPNASAPSSTTAVGPCNCYSASNSTNSLVLPVGTYLSYSLSSFGLNYTVIITCGCSCGCVCTTTYSANSMPSVYVPYAACNTTTSGPTTVASTSTYPTCGVILPGGNASFPAGTYYTNAVPGVNQSVVVSCPCTCNDSFCTMQTVSQTLPTTFIPYLFCSPNVAPTSTSTSTVYSSSSSNAFTSTQPTNAATSSVANATSRNTTPTPTPTPTTAQTTQVTPSGTSTSPTFSSTVTPLGATSTSTSTSTSATATTTLSATVQVQTQTTGGACACYSAANNSNSLVLPIGTYLLYTLVFAGVNYTAELACDCTCGCICNTTYTGNRWAPAAYIPYASCNNSVASSSSPTTGAPYPNCSVALAGGNASFPVGTYYSSPVPGINASVVISCPCSCVGSCTMQTVLQLEPMQAVFTPYMYCNSSNNASVPGVTPPVTRTTGAAPPCVCYTYQNGDNSTVPIGTVFQSAFSAFGTNYTVIMTCSCSCGCVCNTTYVSGVSLPLVYTPYASCGNAGNASTTSVSRPATSNPTYSQYQYPNCTVMLPNSSVGFPPGTNFTSPVLGLNLSIAVACPCKCDNSTCSITTLNSSVPVVNQPYASCPTPVQPATSYVTPTAPSTSPTTVLPTIATSTSACQCLTAQNGVNYLPIGTLFSSAVTIGSTNYTVVLSCACQCGCVCNTTVTANSYLPTVYQPYANCPTPAPPPVSSSQPPSSSASASASSSTTAPCYASIGNGVTFPVGTVMRSNAVLQDAPLGFQVTCPCFCGAVCTLQNFTYAISQMYAPGALCADGTATATPAAPTQSIALTTASPTTSVQPNPPNCSCTLGFNYTVPLGSYYQTITQTSTTTTVQVSGQNVVIPLNFCIQTTWTCPCNCSSACQCTYIVTNLNPSTCPGNVTYPIVPYYYCPSTTSVTTPLTTTSSACMSSIYGYSVPPGSTVLVSMPCFQLSCTCNCSCSSTCLCSFLPTSCPLQAGSYNSTSTVIQGQCNYPVGRRKRSVKGPVSEIDQIGQSQLSGAELTTEEQAIKAGLNRKATTFLYYNEADAEPGGSSPGNYVTTVSFKVTHGLHFSRSEDIQGQPDESALRITKFYLRALLQQTSLGNRIASVGSIAFNRVENQPETVQVDAVVRLQSGSLDEFHFAQECANAYDVLRNRYVFTIDTASCTIANFPAQ